jgi:hypothetical protein
MAKAKITAFGACVPKILFQFILELLVSGVGNGIIARSMTS